MKNFLSTVDSSKWIGDGTEGATLVVNGSTITFGSVKRGTPYNVRLPYGDTDGGRESASPSIDKIFYEIELAEEIEGSLSIGLVTRSEFKPGWKTRGMFYNGNLTNGSAGLRFSFGDSPKAGDTVGVYLIRSDEMCKVAYYLNHRCLGVGFAVSSLSAVFHPCLSIDGKATVRYFAPLSFPSTIDRQPASFDDLYSGEWFLEKSFTGSELKELSIPGDAKVVLTLKCELPMTYRLSTKVANIMNCTLRVIGKEDGFEMIEVGPVMSTMMMPPPSLESLETFVITGLESLVKMAVSSNNVALTMMGPKVKMVFRRHETKWSHPLTKYLQ